MSELSSTAPASSERHRLDSLLAWYFVIVWGSGYLASKTGLQYAAPFTFLSLRFAFGLICLVPIIVWTRPRWPRDRRELLHLAVAGMLMHGVNLSGSHYAQYLGMSAGITALLLATQPLFTAMIASTLMGERLIARQWLGVAVGLAGVALVVWHKIDVRAITPGSLAAVVVGLIGITTGTLYQRKFCPASDLRSAALVQFLVALAMLLPLGWFVEGLQVRWSWPLLGSVAFLVILASILAVSALHTLMRRGQATRVTSLIYLTPIIAVLLEWLMFGVVPTALSVIGIAVTSAGVALVSWRR
jgi:drug/metabolite transporter (DMT)-like permease